MEPVPRRVRGYLSNEAVVDTTAALYVWEVGYYPAFYVPSVDVVPGLLVGEQTEIETDQGRAEVCTVTRGETRRQGSARVIRSSNIARLEGTVRFEWAALDHWFEEDEEVFVHPRNPYARVDCLRSTRTVRAELDGVLLAASCSPMMVFETGLPTRYYFNRTDVHFEHLEASETSTSCPYKGTTSAYWSVRIGDLVHPDVAWAYDFPLREVVPIAGLVAFYNERVDLSIDGVAQERPLTQFTPREEGT